MGLHGSYGATWTVAGFNKDQKSIKCQQCGVRFFQGSKMSRLHIVENNVVTRCLRMESL